MGLFSCIWNDSLTKILENKHLEHLSLLQQSSVWFFQTGHLKKWEKFRSQNTFDYFSIVRISTFLEETLLTVCFLHSSIG